MLEEFLSHRQMVQDRMQKSFIGGINVKEELDIEKARSGTYTDTAENRKLGRVGRQYGSKKQEELKGDKKSSQKAESAKKEYIDWIYDMANESDFEDEIDEFMSKNQKHFF